MRHSSVETNGIKLHVVEAGEGTPVLFCHGFPDTWYTWKKQMTWLGGQGFRCIAVDMRGYGRSSAPGEAAKYTVLHTAGDLVGLLDALGLESVTVVGHDLGAIVAWNAAMMRPDRFTAVFGISVPFRMRDDLSFLDRLRSAGRHDFYMFGHMPDQADQDWSDAEKTVPGALYWSSGTPSVDQRWSPFDPARKLNRPALVEDMPWVDPEYVAYNVAEFKRTGFSGGLNYYRAIQAGFDLSAAFKGAVIRQPSFYLYGKEDGLNEVPRNTPEELKRFLPGLRGHVGLDGVGHWPQHERPTSVNETLSAFLHSVG
jgi:pimeloyl-ACP methyl ester carboxylesterase